MGKKFGEQFSESRFNFGQGDSIVEDTLSECFDARNVVPVEPDETYNNFVSEKRIHQIIDYTGIDYLIDPFDAPAFGVNHRSHSPSDYTLRFDIRKDTGTESPSELDKLLHADKLDIVPKFASRMKKTEAGCEWFRIVELGPFVELVNNSTITRDKEWGDGDVTAWMYDYDDLREHGIVRDIEIDKL
jgi:hypothetical protein